MKQIVHVCIFFCVALLFPFVAFAGNIPQYHYTKGTSDYVEFSDGTAVPCTWTQGAVLFADGSEKNEPYKAQGFPIGFDFTFAGQIFNQFAIHCNGALVFGKDEVDFKGRPGTFWGRKPSYEGDAVYYNTFYAGMMPVACGILTGNISYKTVGEAGSRICTVQFKEMILNEGASKGRYSIQIRIYEKDNIFEVAFKELETCYTNLGGFHIGLRGWNDDDTLLLSGSGIDKQDVGISSVRVGSMLDPKSYVNWDAEDYDRGINMVYTFTPDNTPECPSNAPAGLTVEERNGELVLSCSKAEGADATVLLYSESPFTETDMPTDGRTFQVGQTFGNGTVLYYGDEDNISVTIPSSVILPSRTYYVVAVSANGTPKFNRENYASQSFTATQTPPEVLKATPVSQTSIKLEWVASYPVIIAVSDTCSKESTLYKGVFGQPTADAAVGDEMPEGGKIIYTGEGSEFIWDCDHNQIQYFRVWTVREGNVSSVGTDAYGLPLVSVPYQAEIERYPLRLAIAGWENESPDDGIFTPGTRMYDYVRALVASSSDLKKVSLISPAFTGYNISKITFEFSLETEIYAPDQLLPQGNEPGKFGEGGSLIVRAGTEGQEKVVSTITEYDGTMKPAVDGGYCTGSSTFKTVVVEDLPVLPEDSHIRFDFAAKTKSELYLRHIAVEGPEGVIDIQKSVNTVVYGTQGTIHIFPVVDSIVDIYGIDGCKMATLSVYAGTETTVNIPAGIYLVGGQKVMVK